MHAQFKLARSRAMSREFSKRPVLVKKDASGTHHRFYVMYHATKKENVSSILADGFRESTGGMLGPGLYVSRDIDKTRAYGDVCFKLLVYIGITKLMAEVDTSGDWRSHHHSAYLPPNNDVVPSKREETCLKSAKQARILGIAYGFDSSTMGGRVRNLEGTNEVLDQWERKVLDELVAASLGTFLLLSPTFSSSPAPLPAPAPVPLPTPTPSGSICNKSKVLRSLIVIGIAVAGSLLMIIYNPEGYVVFGPIIVIVVLVLIYYFMICTG